MFAWASLTPDSPRWSGVVDISPPRPDPHVKVRLPRDAYEDVLALAKASGQTPAEWLRELALAALARARQDEMTEAILAAD